MSKGIVIKIIGEVASGKSTIATLIADELRSYGIKVENTDDGDPVVELNLASMAEKGFKVKIETIQAKRA